MNLYKLNLGSRKISNSREYKVIKLKTKIAQVLIWVTAIFFVASLLVNDGVFMFFSIGALVVSLIAIALLHTGLLDIFILKLSRKLEPPKKKTNYTKVG
jgi:hypothetical protein